MKTPLRLGLRLLAAGATVVVAGWLLGMVTTRRYEARSFLTDSTWLAPRPTADGEAFRRSVDREALRRDVETLASPRFEGRDNRTEGGRRARDWLVQRLAVLGVEPVFDGSFLHEIRAGGETVGYNVAGMVAGMSDDAPVVTVVAHYDHLGRRHGDLHPGADDNASSVAIALEVARLLVARDVHPHHHVVFLFPDAEEPPDIRTDRMGSSWFVESGPFPKRRLRLAIVMDLMGGRPIARYPECFYVMGAEAGAGLARLVRETPQPPAGARYELLSVAMIEAVPFVPWERKAKSDYHAFRRAGRPFLFLSAGSTPRYHTPRDTPDSLDYGKMAAEAGFVADLVHRAAMDEEPLAIVPGAVDMRQDVTTATRLLDAFAGDGADHGTRIQNQLESDRRRLDQLASTLDAKGSLSRWQYRELLLIGLRLQCLTTRPTLRFCTSF